MKNIILIITVLVVITSCKDVNKEAVLETITPEPEMVYEPQIEIIPISHATFILAWDDTMFYIDPIGGEIAFENVPDENVILVTDLHGDHMNAETILAVRNDATVVIVPQAVNDKIGKEIGETQILNNNESVAYREHTITAVPMYNLTEERLKFHEKGRGNGYVIEKNGYKVYISGDTEDIPEMRALEGINKAFICMNLPYTMTVEQAVDAVLEFAPDEIYPYHYRGTEGFSDVEKFKALVNTGNNAIEVIQLDWYPN